MPQRHPLSPEELARQARQHVDSLRAAGVEWLPMAPPPRPVQASPPMTGEVHQAAPSLFTESGATSLPFGPSQTDAGLTQEQRRQELQLVTKKVAGCTRCAELAATRTQTVFGVGPLDAPVCFIGEAPGADEDRQGEPFVGAAGQLLNRIIAACGMERDEVYIGNILKCRPPGNRLPLPNEAANCREYLDRQLDLIQPKFICALGACAAQNLLNTTQSIGRLRGQFHDYRGIPVLCTYHPAYLLRSPDKKKDVWEDMKQLLTRMGRPIPRR